MGKTWGALAALALAAALGLVGWWWHRPPAAIEPSTTPWLADMTQAWKLQFIHDAGNLDDFHIRQIIGSGVAVFDFDGDDRPDVYLLSGGGPQAASTNRLFKNLPDGTFRDVTAGSGLGIAGYNTGVAVGDVDNDGRLDVVVAQYGGLRLFLNDGDGTFTDATAASGLHNPQWATSLSLFDYDRDGWLDLVVVNYLEVDPTITCYAPTGHRDYCSPKTYVSTVSRLFHNLGAAKGRGRFEDVTEASGLYQIAGPGLGVYCADFDGDGWPDIFVANDAHANYLWINQRNGTFVERGFAHGIAVDAMGQVLGNMGIAVGDLDGNGLFDLYVTHLTDERNTLWAQGPKRGQFRDRTALAGLFNSAWRGTGFGTVMVDFDNDGWLDLALVNGRVSRGPATHADAVAHLIPYCERNQLFRNEGGGQMRDISPANADFCGRPNVARGLAYGDFDGDGGVDLVLTTVAGPARIYRNIAAPRGHWLALRAIDPRLRRDAYGAEIRVRAGERQWLRILNPVDSFQSSSEPRAYFGLGEAAQFDGIEIVWPDGLVEEFPGGTADRRLVLRRGEGKAKGP